MLDATTEPFSARRAAFVAAVAAEGAHYADGHGEALGWVLADLAAGWPLTYDYGQLTVAVESRPELARALVATAGFTPARLEYGDSCPDGRYVRWEHQWRGTAGELWDVVTTPRGGTVTPGR
jgi:hypothetical protein